MDMHSSTQTHPFEGVPCVIVSIREQLERQQTTWWVVKGYEGVLIWEEMKGKQIVGPAEC